MVLDYQYSVLGSSFFNESVAIFTFNIKVK